MSEFDEVLDLLGRNTIRFLVEGVSVIWSTSAEDAAVDERMQVSLRVTTEPRDDEAKPFTDRYRDGAVTLVPQGEPARTSDGRPILGVLLQYSDALDVRIGVQPAYLAALATLLPKAAGAPIAVEVWPYLKVWEWNGEGHLDVRHCEISVGYVSLPR